VPLRVIVPSTAENSTSFAMTAPCSNKNSAMAATGMTRKRQRDRPAAMANPLRISGRHRRTATSKLQLPPPPFELPPLPC
jgi:hypothetical protein